MPASITIQAGKLRQRIQLARPSLTQDTFGGTTPDQASLYATVWASIEALVGREVYSAQQLTSEVTHKIWIRWRNDVRSQDVVWFDGRQFQIQAVVNPDERHHALILFCIERGDSAREEGGAAA